MSKHEKPQAGSIVWCDLTVKEADRLRDFYIAVVGWRPSPVEMGGYQDYAMNVAGGQAVAGVCHARGPNANLPPQWLIYVAVDDLDAAVARCTELGGEVIDGPRAMGNARFCAIRDPAGAVAGLIGG